MKTIENIELFYREGSSDKVYKVALNQVAGGFTVDFAYGRRGSALNTGSKTPKPVTSDKAKAIYDKLVLEKTAKGYGKDPDGKPFSGAVQLESRDTGFRPQLLNDIEESELEKYFEDSDWCAQEKFDGRRRGLVINLPDVTGTNRKGLTVDIPEEVRQDIRSNAFMQTAPSQITLDGEAIDNYIMVFDMIAEPFTQVTYAGRYSMLKTIFEFGNFEALKLVKTAWSTKEKRELFRELKARNAEGIVFKRVDAKYKAGRPNSGGDQVKFKFHATASCVVTKVSEKKRSISLGVFDSKGIIMDVGNVTVYPNQSIPQPGAIVEVKYLYYFENGSLFQPVLLGERDDMSNEDCTLKQLKLKKKEEVHE